MVVVRGIIAAVFCSALVGCSGNASFDQNTQSANDGADSIRAFVGGPRVQPPDGYCFSESGTRKRDGFFMMTVCEDDDESLLHAVMTIQYGKSGSFVLADFDGDISTYLTAAEGRALLSANGDAETVTVHSVVVDAGVVTLVMDDRAAPQSDTLSTREWRAFFDLRNRLVGVVVRGYEGFPLSEKEGRALLQHAIASARGTQ